MNIWLIQTTEPLPIKRNVRKMRTAFLAEALLAKGHNVIWWTSAFDHFRKEWVSRGNAEIELDNGLKIKTLKGVGYKTNISLSRFIDYRMVAWRFGKIARQLVPPDIIVTAMPHDIVYETVIYAREKNIPIIVDIRDIWPDVFLDCVPVSLRALAKMFLHRDFVMVRKALQMADTLVGATDYFLEWGLAYAKREKQENDRVFPLGYKRPEAVTDMSCRIMKDKFASLVSIMETKFIVLFVGTISRSYHSPFIILDVAKSMASEKDIHFVIGGDGELFDELKQAAAAYPNITLTGWLNGDEIEFILKYSKVSLCPVARAVNLPTNKAFAYLSAGVPVVSSFEGDLRNVIEEYKIGFYYPPNDAITLAECIRKLHDDPVLHKKISNNALGVFEKLFDANRIYEQYAMLVEKVACEWKGPRKA